MVVISTAFNVKEVFRNSIPQKPVMKQSIDMSKPLHLVFEEGQILPLLSSLPNRCLFV